MKARYILVPIGILATLVVIAGVSGHKDKPNALVTALPTIASTYPPSQPAATEPSGISDGVYEVGPDVQVGKYKTAGPDEDGTLSQCYYARYKGDGASFKNLVENGLSKGRQTITVKKTDTYLELTGGCVWTRVS
jgi:hypothetical protein